MAASDFSALPHSGESFKRKEDYRFLTGAGQYTDINPMIVEGQVHGGLVQGIGQALLANCVYDAQSGQLLTGSLMDHAMPRADDFPEFKLDTVCTPCTHNPLGTKGCGEAGAIGSPPAVINAVLDARHERGVTEFDMPASPARVWQAIQAAAR